MISRTFTNRFRVESVTRSGKFCSVPNRDKALRMLLSAFKNDFHHESLVFPENQPI